MFFRIATNATAQHVNFSMCQIGFQIPDKLLRVRIGTVVGLLACQLDIPSPCGKIEILQFLADAKISRTGCGSLLQQVCRSLGISPGRE